MRHLLTIAFCSATLMVSAQTSMTLKGQLKGEGAPGKKVLLSRPGPGAVALDSAIIGADGSFQLGRDLPSPEMMSLIIKGNNGPLQGNWDPVILFFAENGSIRIEGIYDSLIKEQGFRALYYGELSSSTLIKGSRSHELFLKYYQPKSKLEKERDKAFMEYIGYLNPGKGKSKGPMEQGITITKRVDALDKVRKDFSMKYILSNPASEVLAYIAEQTLRQKSLTVEELEQMMNKFSSAKSTGRLTEDFLKKAAFAKRTAVGTDLVDFVLMDVDGKQHRLSDYVGKGRYVLVEFWASWCGPCRADIPHLKEAFNSYHSKGFDIVSVSLDEKHDAWVKAMKDENLTQWSQLIEPKAFKSELTDTYRINGIPACLLFDPQGKLVTYNMRGSFMDAILIQLYGDHFPKREAAE
jgi:thiol-disulfide isomerase/thioredoxin